MLRTIRPFALASVVAVVAGSACAQQVPEHECATTLTAEEAAQYLQTLANMPNMPHMVRLTDGPIVVPLTFHVVRTSAGTGGLSQARLDQGLADANAGWAAAGIQFCVPGPVDYINNDLYYSGMSSNSHYNSLRNTNVVPGTINIYFVESVGFCGLSSFTFSSTQGIIMNNNCTGLPTNKSTFPHEIGHYFDLFHTHETSFGGTECPSGSNCATAGDLVCDTPADPNVLGLVSTNCTYTGGGSACGGQAYNPDVTNFMSYSNKDCRTHFSTGQNDRAYDTLVTLRLELDLNLCAPQTCYADCDQNNTLNVFDYICFGNAYAAQNAYADCDANSTFNVFDYICFGNAYAAGCP